MTSPGLSLYSSDDVLRHCAVTTAHAGRLAVHALADEDVHLRETVDRFVRTHLEVLDVSAAASAAIGRKLSWARQSAHETELEAAAALGRSGLPVPGAVGPAAAADIAAVRSAP
ncbi:hypothetical protein IDVR_09980 [Intrasporangium sp. DVR]